MAQSAHTQFEAREFRDRVRLFVQVLLSIDAFAYVSDVVTPLLLGAAPMPNVPREVTLIRVAQTLVLGATWLLMKYRPLSLRPAQWVETGATLWVVFVYSYVGHLYHPPEVPWFGTVFSLFGLLLLLTLRSALIPSSVARTLAMGASAGLIYFGVSHEELSQMVPAALEGLVFLAAAYLAVIAVASHVIYGLRAEVRDARQLGQYVLQKRLGKGGMGEVYLARHRLLRRATAVKLLPAAASSQSAVTRFESEVQLTAELTHPNTIRIFDYGRTDDGVFYYAMEHLEGATLADVVERTGPLPLGRIIKILLAACGALEEAHEAGLIHRDIKPENLMLTRQGMDPDALKVLDFGLVYRADGSGSGGITEEGMLVGTPLYMAPEVIKQAEAASPASDLYALAAVAYFLATGTPVFRGESIIEICSHHLHTQPESPSQRVGRPLSPDFEALILQCLSKDPADRVASARAFSESLLRCQDAGKWSLEASRQWWTAHGPELRPDATEENVAPRAMTVAAPPPLTESRLTNSRLTESEAARASLD